GKTVEQVGIDFVRAHRRSSIIQRPASTEEIANMIVYVCSPQASATTGAALRVDGGVVDTIALGECLRLNFLQRKFRRSRHANSAVAHPNFWSGGELERRGHGLAPGVAHR